MLRVGIYASFAREIATMIAIARAISYVPSEVALRLLMGVAAKEELEIWNQRMCV